MADEKTIRFKQGGVFTFNGKRFQVSKDDTFFVRGRGEEAWTVDCIGIEEARDLIRRGLAVPGVQYGPSMKIR